MLFRVALFASVCEASVETMEAVPVENLAEMALAEETVANTTWDKARREESIGRLMQSATNLMKSQTTPQVAEFTQATIEAIEDEALPAIRDEHKLDEELILKEFATFKDIGTKRIVAENAIAGLEETEQMQKTEHESCRAAQQVACAVSKKCNSKLAALKKTWDKKEELLAVSSEEIEGTWCKGDTEDQKLEKSFYNTNKGYFKQYIKRKEEAEAAWIAHKDKTPICEGFANNRKANQTKCDVEQDTLQERSCARASSVREANSRVQQEWKVAKGIFKNTSRRVLSAVEDRKKEWVGIHTVKCLLESLKQNSELSEPCDNATHTKKVNKQIESCHDLAEDDTHLTIEPPVVPPTPKRFKLHPAPCMKRYAKWMGFAKLPKCAQAKACTRSCGVVAKDDAEDNAKDAKEDVV